MFTAVIITTAEDWNYLNVQGDVDNLYPKEQYATIKMFTKSWH